MTDSRTTLPAGNMEGYVPDSIADVFNDNLVADNGGNNNDDDEGLLSVKTSTSGEDVPERSLYQLLPNVSISCSGTNNNNNNNVSNQGTNSDEVSTINSETDKISDTANPETQGSNKSQEHQAELTPGSGDGNNNGNDMTDAQSCFGKSSSSSSSSSGRRSPRLSCTADSFDYCMSHERRGRCIIINNKTFEPQTGLNERKGTDLDADTLISTFSTFNFEIQVWRDERSADIVSRLQEMAETHDFSSNDCLIVCVLTHGDRGVLWGRDQRYRVDDIYSFFTSDKCKSLAGKPKLFFIQACQGSSFDRGVFIRANEDQVDAAHYYKIPTWADFLIVYSTIPGYYSWRNPQNGSWFIQALCEVLTKHHTTHDLLSMMTLVARKVSYEFESFCPGQGDFDGNKQVPCITSMLTRRVFLSYNLSP